MFQRSGKFIDHLSNNYFKEDLTVWNYLFTFQRKSQYSLASTDCGMEEKRIEVQAPPQDPDGLSGQSSLLIEWVKGLFTHRQGGLVVNLTTYIHLVVRLRIFGAIPQLRLHDLVFYKVKKKLFL
jgi:hypothetical protein